jgi:hypothetical protein
MHELMSVLVQERFGFEIQFSKLLWTDVQIVLT